MTLFLVRFSSAFRPGGPSRTPKLPGLGLILFISPTAQSGTCIDCHKIQNAQGKKAPTKCMDCHKKGNA